MEIKKFTQGPNFLKPILKGHNQVIDELGQRIDRVSGTDGINVAKIGGDLSISSTYGRTHFRFGIVRQAFYRGQDAIIQMCEYSGLEWHLTRYLQRVDTQFICGYYFYGMPVRLLELPETKTLQIMSDGVAFCKANTKEDYNEAFADTVQATPLGYDSSDITLHLALAETVDSGSTIYCAWDDAALQWDGIAQRC